MELHGAELVVSSPGHYAFECVKEQFINAREIIIITYGMFIEK